MFKVIDFPLSPAFTAFHNFGNMLLYCLSFLPPLYIGHKLYLYTLCAHWQIDKYCTVQLSFKSNSKKKKRVKNKKKNRFTLSFIFTCVVIFTNTLPLHVDSSYCLLLVISARKISLDFLLMQSCWQQKK